MDLAQGQPVGDDPFQGQSAAGHNLGRLVKTEFANVGTKNLHLFLEQLGYRNDRIDGFIVAKLQDAIAAADQLDG